MKLADFKGLFKKSIATVVSIDNPYGDYYIIKLQPESSLKWQAGEHGIFWLPDRKVVGKKWRAFSVASIKEEEHLTLGTRTGQEISSYKTELLNMDKGERVKLRGPFGWFKIRDQFSPVVMIAGGVGITPIRALLKEIYQDNQREVTVIFASEDFYLFEIELAEIAGSNSKIVINKTKSVQGTQEQIGLAAKKHANKAYYYVSGSPNFISSVRNQLKGLDVNRKRIINDPFKGY